MPTISPSETRIDAPANDYGKRITDHVCFTFHRCVSLRPVHLRCVRSHQQEHGSWPLFLRGLGVRPVSSDYAGRVVGDVPAALATLRQAAKKKRMHGSEPTPRPREEPANPAGGCSGVSANVLWRTPARRGGPQLRFARLGSFGFSRPASLPEGFLLEGEIFDVQARIVANHHWFSKHLFHVGEDRVVTRLERLADLRVHP